MIWSAGGSSSAITRMRPKTKLVAQTEDVVVDARGFIYISDKNHGVYVLRLRR